MFADQIVERMSHAVLVWTGVPEWTVPFSEGLAEGSVRIKAEPILSFEKVGESEVVGRWHLRWVKDLLEWICGTGSWRRAAIDRDNHSGRCLRCLAYQETLVVIRH